MYAPEYHAIDEIFSLDLLRLTRIANDASATIRALEHDDMVNTQSISELANLLPAMLSTTSLDTVNPVNVDTLPLIILGKAVNRSEIEVERHKTVTQLASTLKNIQGELYQLTSGLPADKTMLKKLDVFCLTVCHESFNQMPPMNLL